MRRDMAIKLLRGVCKKYNVRIRFVKMRGFDGECSPNGKIIFVNKKLSCRGMAQTVFHELGHSYCIKNGIWKQFHKNASYPAIKSFIVENWIEWWAKREWDHYGMRKIFGQYQFSYLKKNKKKLLKWIKKVY